MSMKQPLLQSFQIIGLHGYKTVSIVFEGPARIVIADNGAGKTTVLSALRNFLSTDFQRFQKLQFESIECRLLDGQSLRIDKQQLAAELDRGAEARLAQLAEYSTLDPEDLRRVIAEFDSSIAIDVRGTPALQEIYSVSPFSVDQIADMVGKVRADLQRSIPENLREVTEQVRKAMKPYELLYLPTYRRVEMPNDQKKSTPNAPRFRPQYPWPPRRTSARTRGSRSAGRIQYGLADVQERLSEIFEEIQRQSNVGYRSLSASIIDDLMRTGRLSDAAENADLPQIEALERFFSRLGQRSPDERIETLKTIYANSISQANFEPLRYFLKKLSNVIDRTRELESNIESFVRKVNDYLKLSSDEKELQYDAQGMRVLVRNLWTDATVDFDDLSSGEKQVISLLANMYLDSQQKIVLIDEPELSLSMDWQRRLLPDLVQSPTCSQLLAITHSPFIFENDLDPYAGPLIVERKGGRRQ